MAIRRDPKGRRLHRFPPSTKKEAADRMSLGLKHLIAVSLLLMIALVIVYPRHSMLRHFRPFLLVDGCQGRLQLASSGSFTVGSEISFFFVNQGTSDVTLASTAPWVVHQGSECGPVVYAATGATIALTVPSGGKYPLSDAWSWVPKEGGDYYIDLAYVCQATTTRGRTTIEAAQTCVSYAICDKADGGQLTWCLCTSQPCNIYEKPLPSECMWGRALQLVGTSPTDFTHVFLHIEVISQSD